MGRKIKKYDLLTLQSTENPRCYISCLVLEIQPEGIKLFFIQPRTKVDFTLKEFKKKFTWKWQG